MSKTGKDSAEVAEFMELFARLKLFSDDAHEDLAELAASDSSVMDLCTQLSFAADPGLAHSTDPHRPNLLPRSVDTAIKKLDGRLTLRDQLNSKNSTAVKAM